MSKKFLKFEVGEDDYWELEISDTMDRMDKMTLLSLMIEKFKLPDMDMLFIIDDIKKNIEERRSKCLGSLN